MPPLYRDPRKTDEMPRCHIVAAVWGEYYIGYFLKFLVRSFLAENNIPAMVRHVDTTFRVFSTESDAETIRNDPAFTRLSAITRTDIVADSGIDFTNPTMAHHRIWARARREALKENAYVLFVAPDSVWADGSLARFAAILQDRPSAVFFPGFRATSETFCPAIRSQFPEEEEDAIRLPAPALMEMAVESMSPLMIVFMRDSRTYPLHAENMIWPVDHEGFVVRQPIAHSLFAIGPEGINVSEFSLPMSKEDLQGIHWVRGSDDILFVSFSPLCSYSDWYAREAPADPLAIAQYSLANDNAIIPALIRRKFRFHFGSVTESRWREVERGSDVFVHRILVARETLRIWETLRHAGLDTAAKYVALALIDRALTRRVASREPVTVFVPSERSLARLPKAFWDRLERPENGRELCGLIRDHVAVGKWSTPDMVPGACVMSHQRQPYRIEENDGRLTVNGAAIINADIQIGEHVMHVIDGFLGSANSTPWELD